MLMGESMRKIRRSCLTQILVEILGFPIFYMESCQRVEISAYPSVICEFLVKVSEVYQQQVPASGEVISLLGVCKKPVGYYTSVYGVFNQRFPPLCYGHYQYFQYLMSVISSHTQVPLLILTVIHVRQVGAIFPSMLCP